MSPGCAQILIQSRPLAFASIENIMTTTLTCAKYKAAGQKPVSTTEKSPTYGPECNCFKTVFLLILEMIAYI